MKSFLLTALAGGGVVAFALFVTGPTLVRLGALTAQAGFALFGLGSLIGLVVTLLAFGVMAKSGSSTRTWVALLAAPSALVLVYGLAEGRKYPLINDVATDTAYPPGFEYAKSLPENVDRDMALPERFKASIQEGYPELGSLGIAGDVDGVFGRAMDIIRDEPNWEVTWTNVTSDEILVEGTASSRLFGFVDDFVIRITSAESGGSVVDMRSKSRDGRGDFGVNAKRIRYFFERLKGA